MLRAIVFAVTGIHSLFELSSNKATPSGSRILFKNDTRKIVFKGTKEFASASIRSIVVAITQIPCPLQLFRQFIVEIFYRFQHYYIYYRIYTPINYILPYNILSVSFGSTFVRLQIFEKNYRSQ